MHLPKHFIDNKLSATQIQDFICNLNVVLLDKMYQIYYTLFLTRKFVTSKFCSFFCISVELVSIPQRQGTNLK